jgi:hypothetical protein
MANAWTIKTLNKKMAVNNKSSSHWLVEIIQQGIDTLVELLSSINNKSNNILNLTNKNRNTP